MKQILFLIISISIVASCSTGDSTDKKTELSTLKKEAAAIQEKISKLETELAVNNSDNKDNAKEIMITVAVPKPFVHYIDVQARVDGDENVTVSSEAPGTVSTILVHPGDKVSKGSILAELDAGATKKAIDEAQNQVDFANTLYIKQKSLWEQKVGSEVQYLASKNTYESGYKRLATLKEQLSMSRIKSPVNGTVDAVDIKIGQAIIPGMPAIRVVNLTNLKVKAEVAEAFISKVKKGNDVVIIFPDAGKEISSSISYSGNVIDPMNRTFNVEVKISNKISELHPNMVASLKIADYKSVRAFVVPVNLIQTGDEGQYLFVADGNNDNAVAKKKVVKTGYNYNGYVEIISGLTEGDQVITTGYQDLVEGQQLSF